MRKRIKAKPQKVATTATSKASFNKCKVLECQKVKLQKLAGIK